MSWREKASQTLHELRPRVDMENLPEARRVIREAYPFGMRKFTPYKVWCEEVRKAFPGLYPSHYRATSAAEQGRLL